MPDIRETAKPGPTFDGESMRAILDRRKTQTRREIKAVRGRTGRVIRVLKEFGPSDTRGYDWTFRDPEYRWHDFTHAKLLAGLPYQTGDVYYARESLIKGPGGVFGDGTPDNECCLYKADGAIVNGPNGKGWTVHWPWKCQHTSSFAMPCWAARVFIRVTDVRVQRLEQISVADMVAEGIVPRSEILGDEVVVEPRGGVRVKAVAIYLFDDWVARWESVNGKGSWERDRNRQIAAYTFEVIQPEA